MTVIITARDEVPYLEYAGNDLTKGIRQLTAEQVQHEQGPQQSGQAQLTPGPRPDLGPMPQPGQRPRRRAGGRLLRHPAQPLPGAQSAQGLCQALHVVGVGVAVVVPHQLLHQPHQLPGLCLPLPVSHSVVKGTAAAPALGHQLLERSVVGVAHILLQLNPAPGPPCG